MAEVAGSISSAGCWQLSCVKGETAEGAHGAKTSLSGPAQNMRRTVIRMDGVLTWGVSMKYALCRLTWGIFNVERDNYEEDTIHYTG